MEGLIVLLVITSLNINICCAVYLFKNIVRFSLKLIESEALKAIIEHGY